MKKAFFSVLSIFAAVFMLVFSGEVREAASGAVSDCLEIIIPSLFLFSALSVFLQKSGLYKTVFKPVTLFLSRLFNTDKEVCGIFLLSNLGGYPVGATLLSALVNEKRLDKKDAARLMCCCFGSGPSFIIGMVGKAVFGSTAAGAVLFAACFLSSFVSAFAVLRSGRITLKAARSEYDLGAECFISSVSAAAKAMFSVCTMIVAFSVITALLNVINANELLGEAAPVLGAALEITRIKDIALGEFTMPICAALLSFGGACVALQTASIAKGRFPLGMFLLSRIPAAALSAAFALLFTRFLPSMSEEVIAGNVSSAVFSGSAPLSVCLLAMSVILLLEERRQEFSIHNL